MEQIKFIEEYTFEVILLNGSEFFSRMHLEKLEKTRRNINK